MSDIATLSLEIQSDGVVVADDRMENFERTARQTTRTTDRLERETRELDRAYRSLGPVLLNVRNLLGAFGVGFSVVGIVRGIDAVIDRVDRFAASTQQLNQLIITTGGTAGRSFGQINELAIELGRNTLASVEGVREAAGVLLTFRSIAEENFDRTLVAAQDLASIGMGSLQSATTQLAKAIEDPASGLTMLRRVGVSFTEAQRDQIRALQETNRLFEAQSMILDVIERQVAGAAVAQAAGTLAGAFDTLNENIGLYIERSSTAAAVTSNLTNIMASLAEFVGAAADDLTPAAQIEALKGQLEDLAEFDESSLGAVIRFLDIFGSGEAVGTQIRDDIQAQIDGLQEIIDKEAERAAAAAENSARVTSAANEQVEAVEGVVESLELEAELLAAQNAVRGESAEVQAELNDLLAIRAALIEAELLPAEATLLETQTLINESTDERIERVRELVARIREQTEAAQAADNAERQLQKEREDAARAAERAEKEALDAAQAADNAERQLQKEREDAARAAERAEEQALDAAKEYEEFLREPLVNAIQDLQSTWTDFIDDALDGSIDEFENWGDAVIDILRRTAANMLSQQITIPITTVLGGAFGMSPQAMGMPAGVPGGLPSPTSVPGYGGGMFDLAGNLYTLGAGFDLLPGLSDLGGLLGIGASGALPASAFVGGAAQGAGVAGVGPAASGLGGLAAYGGPVLSGALTLLTGGSPLQAGLQTGFGLAGAAIGGPPGAAIGTVVGSLVGGLFGSGRGNNAGYRVSGPGGHRQQNTFNEIQTPFGSVFVSGDSDAESAIADAMAQVIEATDASVAAVMDARTRNFVTGAIERFSTEQNIRDKDDNAIFGIARERLVALGQAAAEASGSTTDARGLRAEITSGIGRSNENVEALIRQGTEVIDFITNFEIRIEQMIGGFVALEAQIERGVLTSISDAVMEIEEFKDRTDALGLSMERAEEATRAQVERMIGLREAEERSLTTIEASLLEIETLAENLDDLIAEVGISAEEAAGGIETLRMQLAEGFVAGIEEQLEAINDPGQRVLRQFEGGRATDLRSQGAALFRAGLVTVEELIAAEELLNSERRRLTEQYLSDAGLQYEQALRGVRFGPDSAVALTQQVAELEALFIELSEEALGGSEEAAGQLASVGGELLRLSRVIHGSTVAYADDQRLVEEALEAVAEQAREAAGDMSGAVDDAEANSENFIAAVEAARDALVDGAITDAELADIQDQFAGIGGSVQGFAGAMGQIRDIIEGGITQEELDGFRDNMRVAGAEVERLNRRITRALGDGIITPSELRSIERSVELITTSAEQYDDAMALIAQVTEDGIFDDADAQLIADEFGGLSEELMNIILAMIDNLQETIPAEIEVPVQPIVTPVVVEPVRVDTGSTADQYYDLLDQVSRGSLEAAEANRQIADLRRAAGSDEAFERQIARERERLNRSGRQFGGSFIVPPGFQHDTFGIGVSSGERVDVTPVGQQSDTAMEIKRLQEGQRQTARILARIEANTRATAQIGAAQSDKLSDISRSASQDADRRKLEAR